MFESKQNQPNLYPNQDKYLIINSAVMLDAIVTSRVQMEGDLVLRQLEEGVFSILKDGKQLVKYLDKLTTEHGYTLVLDSNRKEHQIIHALEELDEACKREGLNGFPKITTIIVKDRETYQNVRASDLKIVKGRTHGILVAGYSLQPQKKTEILNGYSKLLRFSKLEQSSYIVLDNRPSFIEKTKEEGWNIYDTRSISLNNILRELCQKAARSSISQEYSYEQEGAEKANAIDNNSSTGFASVLETHENTLQTSVVLKNLEKKQNLGIEKEEEKKELIENDFDSYAPPSSLPENRDHNPELSQVNQTTEQNLNDSKGEKKMDNDDTRSKFIVEISHSNLQSIGGLHIQLSKNDFRITEEAVNEEPFRKSDGADDESLHETDEKKYHNESQVEQKQQYEKIEATKETVSDKELASKKLMISNKEFTPLKKPSPGGSNFTRWFTDERSKTEWIGKCSISSVRNNDRFSEYKELLASKIYELFGVSIPQTLLTEQCLDEKIRNIDLWKNLKDIDKPKIHIISQFVPDFELVGKNFVQEYKNSSKKDKKEPFRIKEEKILLRGFGRVTAIAVLIHDFDFIGRIGTNIGVVPKDNGKYYEILKIDPGEALTLEEHLREAKVVHNRLDEKGAVTDTSGKRINFNELNDSDQREFVETLKEILEVKEFKLEEIFLPFIALDNRFRRAFEELLNRRQQFLFVFASEVRELITLEIRKIEKQQAEEYATGWGQLPRRLSIEFGKKAELIRNQAQLEAYTVVGGDNSKDLKRFQVSHQKQAFVGREAELSQIKKLFSGNTGIIGCAIVGGPGLGKSQLATEYIIKNQKEIYSEVVWLHAEQSDLIVDQIQIYLETCYKIKFDPQDKDKKTTIIRSFYQILEDGMDKSSKKYCVVFDNADSMAQIADYLPDNKTYPKLKIDIIVTSRYKKWEEPVGTIIEMQAFEIEETKNYIKSYFSLSGVDQDNNQLSIDAQRLNELVGGLPIALSLAVAYIQQKGLSISEFCNFVAQENNKEFIPLQDKGVVEKAETSREDKDELKSMNIVSTVLTLALTDLRRKKYSVESILNIIAYLSPDDIRTNLLAECWSQCQKRFNLIDPNLSKLMEFSLENTSSQLVREDLKELSVIENSHETKSSKVEMEDFNEALELMLSYSLVAFNPTNLFLNQTDSEESASKGSINSKSIKMHRLTQQVIRLNHQKSYIFDRIYENVFEWIVTNLHYDEKEMKDVRRAAFLIPHGIYLENLQNNINTYKITELQEAIGWHQLYGVANYRVALVYYQKALEIKKRYYGDDHPQTGTTLNNLGNALGSLGDYEKQKDLLTRALVINEKHYGKDHPETGITLTNLGIAWGSLGDYEKQKDLLTRTLVIMEKRYGKDHPNTGNTLMNLGNAWGNLGDYEKQKDLLIRALVIIEKHYGKDHPLTGSTLTILGNAWGSLGGYEKKKDLLTQALEINEKHYGKDHPNIGMTLNNLGSAWGSLGDYEKQKDLLTRALVIIEKHYGKDHPETGITLNNLGNAWGSLGDYEKQKDLLTQALVIKEKHYGKDHPETSMTLNNLGSAWGSLGDYEKQKDLLTRALVIIEKHYGKDHPETGMALNNLSNALGSLGDYEKKKDLLTQALVINEKHYGKDHPQTAIILNNLGNAWESLGDYEKKKYLLARALEINEKHYGKDHPQTGITLMNLASVWGSLGDYEKQKNLLTRTLVIDEKHYGKDHPQTGITLMNLSDAWRSLGDYEKQKDALTRALGINEKHYGKDHPQTGMTLGSLGNAWGSLGDYEKQKNLLTRALIIMEKHYGEDHPQTGMTLGSLGNAWGSLGDYEKQKNLLTRSLIIMEKHYGEDHPQTGMTLGSLGNAWGSLGDYEKKKNLLTRSLIIMEKHYGKDHPNTGIKLTNLGNAWGSLGDYEKQKGLLTRALVIYEKHYGEDHPETGITLGNLGSAWGSLGDYEKCKDFLTRALVIFEKHYGKDHLQTASILNNLGNAWESLGDYEKQKDVLTRALVIKEKHYGKDHPQTVSTLANLGCAWGSLGDYEKKKDLTTRALAIFEKHYGEDHPIIGMTLKILGSAWGSLGDYEKQKDLLTRALVIIEKHYGKDHPETGATLTSLGDAWGSLGYYEKQKDLLTRSLEIIEKHYGKDHPQTGITFRGLGNALGSLGDYEKQKDLLTRTLKILEEHYGKDHPETGKTLTNLGNAWGSLGDYEKQKDLLTRSLVIIEKHYGKDHSQTGITLRGLGNALGSLGDYEKQKDLLTRALEINEKHYGKDHPETAITLENLGNAWGKLGDNEKKKDHLTRALNILESYYSPNHPHIHIIKASLTKLSS